MRQPRLLLLTSTLAVAAAAPLGAQAPASFDIFAQRMEPSSSPLFGGIALSRFSGPLGIRLSGALHFSSGDDGGGAQQYATRVVCRHGQCQRVAIPVGSYDQGSSFPSLSGWTADADLVFEPLRPIPVLRSLLLGFSPYAFGGVGGVSASSNDGIDTTRATWSLGGGVRHALVGALGVSAEARYRHPFSSDSAPSTSNLRQRLEYRAGLTIAFGGHKPKSQAATATPAAPVPESAPADLSGARVASRVLDAADGYVDTPYRRGGTSPQSGFDAPGFVQYVFAQQGVRLPRTTRELADAGVEVSTRIGSLRPGDILLFANDGTTPDHVAIYAGRSRIIHSTSSGGGVRYDVLGEGERGEWFADHLVAARRVVGDSPASRDAEPDDDASGRPDRAPRPTGGSR